MTIKELCTKVREAAEPFAAWGVGTAEEDAAFRKAVTPSAVLALLGRIEELEKLVGNSVHALDYAMSEMVSDAPLRRKVEATRSACAKALSGDTP